jgi:hypothetical protein
MMSPFPEITSRLTRDSDSAMNGGPMLFGALGFEASTLAASGLHAFRDVVPRLLTAHERERHLRSKLIWLILTKGFVYPLQTISTLVTNISSDKPANNELACRIIN